MNPDILTKELINFIEGLRFAGYNIGATQYVAAQDLIFTLAAQGKLPSELTELRQFLAPILCHSPKEQAEFEAHFNQWVSQFPQTKILLSPKTKTSPKTQFTPEIKTTAETEASPLGDVESELRTIQKGNTLWKWVLIAFAMVFVSSIFVYWSDITHLFKLMQPDEIQPVSPSLWDRFLSLQVGLTLLSPLLVLLLWRLWWRYRAQLFLARQTTTTLPEIRKLFVKGTDDKFFQSVSFARTAQKLRQHISMPANVLDITATVEKTTQAGGWFTPITGTIKTRPEYLALIDRTTFNDHQTQLINSLINQLVAEEVLVTRYYFDTVPRRCYPEQSQRAPLTLTELAERYPEHRLLVFSDGNGLINPITCQVVNWIEQFSVWSQRALFTLETPEQWGYREQILDEANFIILPANEKGLKGLVERINTGTWQPYPKPSDSFYNQFPEYIQERPRRWLEHHAPDASVLTALLKQVRDFLGKTGYYWFSACAVYPELRWQLTLYLGAQLKSLTEEHLAKLARLPWFRYGYMPDWLRRRLVDDLSLPQEHKIRTALYNRLLETSDKPLSDFSLDIAKPQQNALSALAQRLLPRLAQQAPKNSPLHEHVFMTFMADKLAVNIPKMLRDLFRSDELPSLFSLLWLILMQPFTLRHRLKACGIENPDASVFKLWFAKDETRSIKHQYVKQFLLLLLVVMPIISMVVVTFSGLSIEQLRFDNLVIIIVVSIIMGMAGSMMGYMSSFIATTMAIGVGIGIANAIFGIGSDVVGVAIAGIFWSAATADETSSLGRIVAISVIFGVGTAVTLGVLTGMGDISVIKDVTYIFGGVLGSLANGVIGGVLYGVLIGVYIFIALAMLQKIVSGITTTARVLAGGVAIGIVFIIIFASVIFYAGKGNPPSDVWWYKVLLSTSMAIIGYLRLPIYLIEALWQIICYTIQKTTNLSTLRFVPVLYHNLSFLPHPFLARHIILGAKTEPKLAKKVIDACAFSPGQYHTGQVALARLHADKPRIFPEPTAPKRESKQA
ncbi:MAG: hypothetical protein DRR19_27545 [Candidatus Parabeggiatoa sp. nov. 1]|nr:MAG: hypothetical protein DRR19_27545 [Gammaproteobacteria bacterium]